MSWGIVARILKTKVGSASGKAVLLALANHCDDAGKSCFPGQVTIENITELSADTIQRQIKMLIGAGFVTTAKERKKGHWASLNYEINLSMLWSDHTAPCGTVAENQAAPCGTAIPHHAARPYRTMRHKPSTKPFNEPSRPKAPSALDGLGSLGANVRNRVGPDKFKAWLSDAEVVSQTPEVVTFALPTKFKRDYVLQNLERDLLLCCQAQSPSVERVSVIVRQPA